MKGGPVVQGIDLDAQGPKVVVDRAMRGELVGVASPDDRTPIDVLVRAYHGLDAYPQVQAALSTAVAGWAETGNAVQKGLSIHFFGACPAAPGGQIFARLAAREQPGDYAFDAPDPTPGAVGGSLRESLLYAAARWKEGAAVDPALISAIEQALLAGRGAALISAAARHDRAWFDAQLERLLALYPGRVGAVWKALVDAGAEARAAAERVLAHANAEGRESLTAFLRFDRRLAPTERAEILALI